MSRMDIVQPRAGADGRTYWTRLGSAWPAKQGPGYSLNFDALPIPSMNDKGQIECRVLLREPLPPRDGARPAGNSGGYQTPADLDDETPF